MASGNVSCFPWDFFSLLLLTLLPRTSQESPLNLQLCLRQLLLHCRLFHVLFLSESLLKGNSQRASACFYLCFYLICEMILLKSFPRLTSNTIRITVHEELSDLVAIYKELVLSGTEKNPFLDNILSTTVKGFLTEICMGCYVLIRRLEMLWLLKVLWVCFSLHGRNFIIFPAPSLS